MVRTRMPVVGGILSIISGVVSLFGALFLLLLFFAYYAASGIAGTGLSVNAAGVAIFTPVLIFSILAIVGGVCALKRRLWGLAMAGAICAILTVLAWALGVASVVLLMLSKREFDSSTSPSLPRP